MTAETITRMHQKQSNTPHISVVHITLLVFKFTSSDDTNRRWPSNTHCFCFPFFCSSHLLKPSLQLSICIILPSTY